jgi:glycine/D-amino acid oxidase-like deaminating enzyme
MKKNNSPWLTQLHKDRNIVSLQKDVHTDVVVVGAGIAGITTLYFLLTQTDKNSIVLEGHKISHGATGHNAGQVVAEFEKPLKQIVKEHGLEKAVAGVRSVELAWDLLKSILKDTKIDIPFHEFVGCGGYSELEQLLNDLETEQIRKEHGFSSFPVLVSFESGWFTQIPEEYKSLCKEVSQDEIFERLDVLHPDYHAVIQQHKAVVNSALFTEKLALWCLETFPSRCSIFEYSFVHGVELEGKNPVVITNEAKVSCEKVVLCTNGFENFYIHDTKGVDIDGKFHHVVQGAVGYMTGFVSEHPEKYMANYFYDTGKIRGNDPFSSDPYFYVTKRNFKHDAGVFQLMTIGGPEVRLDNREIYHKEFETADELQNASIRFAEQHFDMTDVEHRFFWHGLMGYTTSGVRLVGPEPLEPRLLYNLGCNGVGILPSIMGAQKIARHINGEKVEPTIFDPKR